jgi:hypothetical protein
MGMDPLSETWNEEQKMFFRSDLGRRDYDVKKRRKAKK